MSEIRGLSIRQPWAWAIAAGHKPVENRSWSPTYRGLIAIHASGSDGPRLEREVAIDRIITLTGLRHRQISERLVRSAILAVARLEAVCEESPPYASAVACACGPWAVAGEKHIHIADVQKLPVPVPCKGALGLWRLPDDREAAVRGQLAEKEAGTR